MGGEDCLIIFWGVCVVLPGEGREGLLRQVASCLSLQGEVQGDKGRCFLQGNGVVGAKAEWGKSLISQGAAFRESEAPNMCTKVGNGVDRRQGLHGGMGIIQKVLQSPKMLRARSDLSFNITGKCEGVKEVSKEIIRRSLQYSK